MSTYPSSICFLLLLCLLFLFILELIAAVLQEGIC